MFKFHRICRITKKKNTNSKTIISTAKIKIKNLYYKYILIFHFEFLKKKLDIVFHNLSNLYHRVHIYTVVYMITLLFISILFLKFLIIYFKQNLKQNQK